MNKIEFEEIAASEELKNWLMSKRRSSICKQTGSSLFTDKNNDVDYIVNLDQIPPEFQKEILLISEDFLNRAAEEYRDISCVIDVIKNDLKFQFVIPMDQNHYERWAYATQEAYGYFLDRNAPRSELLSEEKMFRIGFFEACKYIKSQSQTK